MKNTLRCCISCILPCGALDVIRIVHVNGRVEELTGTIHAAEVLKAYPKHVLKKPTTTRSDAADSATTVSSTPHRPSIVVVPPDAELQRGKIYFLIPVVAPTTTTPSSNKKQTRSRSSSPSISSSPTSSTSTARRKRREVSGSGCNKSISVRANQYLSEILSEKVSTQRERRRGRVAIWRPHLESICETLSDAASSTDHHQ